MAHTIKQYISNHRDLFCILCVCFICLLFLSPYIFSNPAPLIYPVSELGTDLTRDVLPNIEYIVNTLKDTGQLPLWRDFLLSGLPIVGHPSIPLFYPPFWLLLILPIPLGLNLLALLNCCWLGIGMYFFLRFTGNKNPIPALFGAIAMAISPKWIAHLSGGHWYMLAAIAWIPWALFFLDRYFHSKRVLWLFLLAIAMASLGMNHMPMFIITGLTLAFCTLTYLSPKEWKSWFKNSVIGWGIVILLTIGLIAGQILPFLEIYPNAMHTVGNSTFTSLNPMALLVSIFPPDLKYPEWFFFPGLSVLVFAGLSWGYGWTRFEKFWGILGAMGLILSLGEYTPLYSWLFGWNHLISVLRVPTRWWLLTIIALVVLATSGFNAWMENRQRLNRRARTVILLILGLEILAGIIRVLLGNLFPFDTLPTAIFAILLGIILALGHQHPSRLLSGAALMALTIELMVIGGSLIQPQPASETGVSAELSIQLKSNLNEGERIYSPGDGFPALALVRSGIDAAEGYDALPLSNYVKFIRLATGCPLVQEATGSKEELAACLNPGIMKSDWLKLINVRYLAVQHDQNWEFTELAPGAGRAFSVWRVAPVSSESCLTELENSDPARVALVEGEVVPQQNGLMKLIDRVRGVNTETFQVEVADSPALLIRSESWAPGWHASVDGNPVDVLKVDCILQGVWLMPGKHSVTFQYQPFGYPLGVWISAGTLLGMCIWVIFEFVVKKRRTSLS